MNQIDHDTVRVECFDDFCRLSCKHRLFGFQPGSHDFKSVILQCRNRKVHPFRVQVNRIVVEKSWLHCKQSETQFLGILCTWYENCFWHWRCPSRTSFEKRPVSKFFHRNFNILRQKTFNPTKVTKCETTVFEQFDVPEAAVDVNCTAKKCNVKCKTGKVPTFVWPDGKKVPKSTYICKGRSNWVPRAGQITCP